MNDHIHHLTDAYHHDLLDGAQRVAVELHAATCAECHAALAAARLRWEALHRARPLLPDATNIVQQVAQQVQADKVTPPHERRGRVLKWVGGFIAASLLILSVTHLYYVRLEATPLDLRVHGQSTLQAGSMASLRVLLEAKGAPVSGVPVTIALLDAANERIQELARFTTDVNGTGTPLFTLPEWADGRYTLHVRADHGKQIEEIKQNVELRREAKVLLSTDKPVYQPGQVIRMRALGLRAHNLQPLADETGTLSVVDPKGNIIYKKELPASRYGLFSTDCELADELTEGNYRIQARIGATKSETIVTVQHYVLPKFKIDVKLDKPYFKPNEALVGTIHAKYFHGETVNGLANVTLDGSARQVQIAIKNGVGKLYFTPGPEQGDNLHRHLRVQITDTAEQQITTTAIAPVSTRDLIIKAHLVDGVLLPNVPTPIMVHVAKPNGEPVQARLTSPAFANELVTDVDGLALFDYTPMDTTFDAIITARTANHEATQEVSLRSNFKTQDVYVRTGKRQFVAGEALTLNLHGSDGRVYVDLLRYGQTIYTESLTLTAGHATTTLDLAPEWFGPLDIVAYRPNTVERGHRRTPIEIFPATQLLVQGGVQPQGANAFNALVGGVGPVSLDYRPGSHAKMHLRLVDSQGRPTVGAVSLAAVDESVFHVPTAAMPTRDGSPVHDPFPTTLPMRMSDRRVALRQAEAGPMSGSFAHSINATTLREKMQEVFDRQRSALDRLGLGWAFFVVLLVGYTAYVAWPQVKPYFMRTTEDGETIPPSGLMIAMATAIVVIALGLSAVWLLGTDSKATFEQVSFSVGVASADRAMMRDGTRVNNMREMEQGIMPFRNDRRTPLIIDDSNSMGIRVREEFPETLLWKPELITDEQGRIDFDFQFADVITSWQFTAAAVDVRGQMGTWRQDVRVTQPFFVDVNLPALLMRNDQISVPVVVSNYLGERQTIRVELPDADWYKREGPASREVTLEPNAVQAVSFTVQVTKAGKYPLVVTGRTPTFADAVRRVMRVVSDGYLVEEVANGSLRSPASVTVEVPANAIENSPRAVLKLYPSGLSQLIEGLEGIFQTPHGCFEQTSSTTYPNIMALSYLKQSNKAAPDIESTAKRFIGLGYQRLLTFEVSGGGFDWYGRGPANRGLSAYGLMQFRDMAKVADIDPDVLKRTRSWLLKQRRADGTWAPDWNPTLRDHDQDMATLRTTAYIAWAVFQDHADDAGPTKEFLLKVRPDTMTDPYTIALLGNALEAMKVDTTAYRSRLLNTKTETPEGHVYWRMPTNSRGVFFTGGDDGHIEATALALLALQADQANPDVVRQGLNWLTSKRTPQGTWGSTQATILALKALLVNAAAQRDVERRFQITLGNFEQELTVPANQSDVLKMLDLTKHLQVGANTIRVRELTDTSTTYQVTWKYNVPEPAKADSAAFTLTLNAEQAAPLHVNDRLTLAATLTNISNRVIPMVMVELPLPVGFALETDPQTWVSSGLVDKVERKSGTLVLYIRVLDPGQQMLFNYRLRATSTSAIRVPSATAYEYYAPRQRTLAPTFPLRVGVKDAKLPMNKNDF